MCLHNNRYLPYEQTITVKWSQTRGALPILHSVHHTKASLMSSLNIWGCELYSEVPVSRPPRPVKPNRPYDWANCYCCGKELKGAGKTGKIKNRNNPSFWGINTEYRILCLGCLGKKYLKELNKSKRRTFQKYVKRGYV